MQRAVDAQAHAPALFERLDVQIGGIATGGFAQRIGEQTY
jgi:hypothetical protein